MVRIALGAALVLLAPLAASASGERLVAEGRALYERGRLVEARDRLLEAHRLEPARADAPYLLGLIYLKGERYEQAESWLQEAIERGPSTPAYRYSLGVVRLSRGDPGGAIGPLAEAVRLQPPFADAHAKLGRAYDEAGREDEAARAYRAALERDPRHVEALFALGLLEKRRGALDAAKDALARSYEARPEARVLYNLAQIARLEGRKEEAADLTRRFAALRAIEREKELQDRRARQAGDMVERARLDLAEGDAPGARRLLERSVALAPTERAFRLLAKACRDLGDEDAARRADLEADALAGR